MLWLLLFVFGVGIGILSGLLGIGGGIVLVPGLIFLFGFSQAEAQGTSLAVMIPPIGIFAALVYYQNGFVRLPVVGLIALGFILGAYLGAKQVPHLSLDYLRMAFGGLMLYLGFTFLLSSSGNDSKAALPAGVATVTSLTIAIIFRRQFRRGNIPDSPNDQHEYHI